MYKFETNATKKEYEHNSTAFVRKNGIIIIAEAGQEAHDFLREAVRLMNENS